VKLDLSPIIYYFDYLNQYPEIEVHKRGKIKGYYFEDGTLKKKEGVVFFGPIKKLQESQLPSEGKLRGVFAQVSATKELESKLFLKIT